MKIRVVVLSVAIVLLAAACGAVTATPAPTPQEATGSVEMATVPATEAATPTSAPSITTTVAITPTGGVTVALAAIQRVDGTLATVNGQDITWADYEPELIQSLHSVTQQYGLDWNQAENIELLATFQDQILETVIDRTLLRQQAAKEGIEVSPEELQVALDEQKEGILSSGEFSSWDQFQEQFGVSEEYFARLIQDSVLIDKVNQAHAPAREAEQVHARHILVADAETGQQVLDRLDAGEDWAALASEYSLDTGNKDTEGDLGWFPRGMMVPAFEDVAFALEPGATSDLVQTDFGFHIIQVLETGTRDLDEEMYGMLVDQAFQTWMEEIRASAEITGVVQFASEAWTAD